MMNEEATFYEPSSRADWREWLEKHHDSAENVWVVVHKKGSGRENITVPEIIDECMCFAWIDSKKKGRDTDSYLLYVSRRNPKANWSRVNKNKVARLKKKGLLSIAGLKMIQEAKRNGSWDALNDVEDLIIPPDMMTLFNKDEDALANWDAFPRNVKRATLEWIFNAKKEATRERRIEQAVLAAGEGERLF